MNPEKIDIDLKDIDFPTNKEMKWLEATYFLASKFSTCSRKQYSAIIIADNGRVAGLGYNGSAPNSVHCNDGGCPRVFQNPDHGTQYDNCIAIHAEANALLWSDIVMRNGATLIVNGPPCYSCAKLIAGSGISTVVCEYDPAYENFREVIDYLLNHNIKVKVAPYDY